MSIIEAYNKAWENGDTEALANIIHDDCVFNPHVGGITMSKSDILGFAGGDNRPNSEHDRILFENEEVGVAHSIVHFANDSDSEAVLSFMRFKDGQIVSMETGATPLSDDYQLIESYTLAITFNSTAIGVGSARTATVVRAQRISEKYSAYTSL